MRHSQVFSPTSSSAQLLPKCLQQNRAQLRLICFMIKNLFMSPRVWLRESGVSVHHVFDKHAKISQSQSLLELLK